MRLRVKRRSRTVSHLLRLQCLACTQIVSSWSTAEIEFWTQAKAVKFERNLRGARGHNLNCSAIRLMSASTSSELGRSETPTVAGLNGSTPLRSTAEMQMQATSAASARALPIRPAGHKSATPLETSVVRHRDGPDRRASFASGVQVSCALLHNTGSFQLRNPWSPKAPSRSNASL